MMNFKEKKRFGRIKNFLVFSILMNLILVYVLTVKNSDIKNLEFEKWGLESELISSKKVIDKKVIKVEKPTEVITVKKSFKRPLKTTLIESPIIKKDTVVLDSLQ